MIITEEDRQTAADLNATADYIEEHGWCRNAAFTSDGRVCALGAKAAVIQAHIPGAFPRQQRWTNALLAEIPADYIPDPAFAAGAWDHTLLSIVCWNDSQRDRRVVTRAMRRAARKLLGAKR